MKKKFLYTAVFVILPLLAHAEIPQKGSLGSSAVIFDKVPWGRRSWSLVFVPSQDTTIGSVQFTYNASLKYDFMSPPGWRVALNDPKRFEAIAQGHWVNLDRGEMQFRVKGIAFKVDGDSGQYLWNAVTAREWFGLNGWRRVDSNTHMVSGRMETSNVDYRVQPLRPVEDTLMTGLREGVEITPRLVVDVLMGAVRGVGRVLLPKTRLIVVP